MPTVLAILAEGFEEIEAITPIDLLRRAGADVIVAALADSIHVTGRTGVTIHADTFLSDVESTVFDCLFLPGGPGTKLLRSDPRVPQVLARHATARRWIAAICAAPTVLHDAGLLRGRRYTAHFSVASELTEIRDQDPVVVDDNIITSRGAGTAFSFGLELVTRLFSSEKSVEIARSVCS